MSHRSDRDEWLETDGLGGFVMGTVTGVRTRRYHALVQPATTPPTGRFVLLNGFDAWVEQNGNRTAISTQQYPPDVRYPDGATRITSFAHRPWPTWIFRLPDGTEVTQEILMTRGAPVTLVKWHARGAAPGTRLIVRPFLSGRDFHATHHENPAFRFDAQRDGPFVVWQPYADVPAVAAAANGAYVHEPVWYRNFVYAEERERGLDYLEDLGSPGWFRWELSQGPAIWLLVARTGNAPSPPAGLSVEAWAVRISFVERMRRARFATPLHRSADTYIVKRGSGRTIIAGYPWFADWGRDTFIALRGLCIATGRLGEAGDILLEWAGQVSQGMLPNRFAEEGAAEFNSVDAALWYVIAVRDWLCALESKGKRVPVLQRRRLSAAVQAILSGYASGTRHGIRLDSDGLLAAGEPGIQLTWMDAKVGDRVITPRIGKPVEVQALWLNALDIGGRTEPRWLEILQRGRRAFEQRFWNEACSCLHDVIDVDHRAGAVDATFRPNQIFAVGGLPLTLLNAERASRVVAAVEQQLWTPLGLRSLAPTEPAYVKAYRGGPAERDAAYHQGPAWPWLIGAFVDAWVRVHGSSDVARAQARQRFLEPLLAHLDEFGLGHVSEIADAEPPFQARGCPFQAWSLGEVLRLWPLCD